MYWSEDRQGLPAAPELSLSNTIVLSNRQALLALSFSMRFCCHSNLQGHIPQAPEPEQTHSQEERLTAAALLSHPLGCVPSDDLTVPLRRQQKECRPHSLPPFTKEGTEAQNYR